MAKPFITESKPKKRVAALRAATRFLGFVPYKGYREIFESAAKRHFQKSLWVLQKRNASLSFRHTWRCSCGRSHHNAHYQDRQSDLLPNASEYLMNLVDQVVAKILDF